MDPALKSRKKKKVEKELRMLERKGEKHLKPIEEFELGKEQMNDLQKGFVHVV